jgi:TRAP-type mannitol/chloroaromatic compound transport system permease small subunit
MVTARSEPAAAVPPSWGPHFFRFLAWSVVTVLFAFLLNVYLTFWRGWPGAGSVLGEQAPALGWGQALLYAACVVGAAGFVAATRERALRRDAQSIYAVTAFIVRASFWMVLLIGVTDAVISFLRVEGLLEHFVSQQVATDLGRNKFRGPNVHLPLIGVSLVLAAFTRTLGFTWLALLVVVAELQIVVTRFIFSYEQAFMGDLVRFWYGGMFLFASAYTLIEEGHVRVDVLYSGFSLRTKGLSNAAGCLLLGLPLCWVVLIVGLGQPSSIIASPLLALEVSQAGFGMYVKYLMGAFLGVFAVTMALQFCGYLLEAIADFRGDPGHQEHEGASFH